MKVYEQKGSIHKGTAQKKRENGKSGLQEIVNGVEKEGRILKTNERKE